MMQISFWNEYQWISESRNQAIKWSGNRPEAECLESKYCDSQNLITKITIWITLDNYRLQKVYQQKVETNKDEFKNHKNIHW